MFKRSSVIIDSDKGEQFIQFLKISAKNEQFWDDVRKGASVEVNKEELDRLFERE